MSIKHLSVSYRPDEDRLFLTVTTQQNEVVYFWLTQRASRTLLWTCSIWLTRELEGKALSSSVEITPAVIEQGSVNAGANTVTLQSHGIIKSGMAEASPQQFPVGAESFLVTHVEIIRKPKNGDMEMGFFTSQKNRIGIACNISAVDLMQTMLDRIWQYSEWLNPATSEHGSILCAPYEEGETIH
jgi:hypothetical protein